MVKLEQGRFSELIVAESDLEIILLHIYDNAFLGDDGEMYFRGVSGDIMKVVTPEWYWKKKNELKRRRADGADK